MPRRPKPVSSHDPPHEAALPDKPYFKIGEAARLLGVAPSVLRYWEGEFPREIKPERTAANQRVYRRADIATFMRIKRLRYEEQLPVAGTRRRLRSSGDAGRELSSVLRDELESLLRMVDEDEAGE